MRQVVATLAVLALLIAVLGAMDWLTVNRSEEGTQVIIEFGRMERAAENAAVAKGELVRRVRENIERAFDGAGTDSETTY